MKIFKKRTFLRISLLFALFIVLGCGKQQSLQELQPFTPGDKQEILSLLDRQALDWSNGNLEKFMDGYWQSDSLQFIGKSGIKYGWQSTMENYKKNFPDTVAMGKLRFEILKINPVSGDAAFLTGRFFLKRTIGDMDGIFTLVFRKIDGQWLCVYDHTS